VLERCPLPHEDHAGPAAEAKRWYCFNDTRVDPFNVAQLGEQCFGGSSWEGGESYQRPYSGYMLFYQKQNQAHRAHPGLKCPLPLGVSPIQDAEMKEQEAMDRKQAASSVVEDQVEEVKESTLDAGQCDVSMSDGLPTDVPSVASSTSSSSSHKRKLHQDEDVAHMLEESKAAAGNDGEDDDSNAESDALSPEDEQLRLQCTQYRTDVATGPVGAIRRCVTVEEANALLPWRLFSSIWRSNTSLTSDVFQFDAEACKFVWHYGVLHAYDFTPDASDRTWSAEKGDRLQMTSIELALRFLADTLIYAKAKMALPDWDVDLRRMVEGNVAASRFLLDYLAQHMALLLRVLVVNNVSSFRKGFSAAILAALATVRRLDADGLLVYEHPPRDEHKSKRQRTNEQPQPVEGSGVDSVDDDESSEEEEQAEVDAYRPTATGRFLGAMLSVPVTSLTENWLRAPHWWSLLCDVAAMGEEERLFMLLKHDTIVLIVQSLLGSDCAAQLPEEDRNEHWTPLKSKRLRRKSGPTSIKSMLQLISALLPHACAEEGGLDPDRLFSRQTRKVLEDQNNFWDLVCAWQEDLDIIAPVATIIRTLFVGEEKHSIRLLRKLTKQVLEEDAAVLQFTLPWLTALIRIEDDAQDRRVRLAIAAASQRILGRRDDGRPVFACIQWLCDLLDSAADNGREVFLIKQLLVRQTRLLHTLFTLMVDESIERESQKEPWRQRAYELVRRLAREAPAERAAREEHLARCAATLAQRQAQRAVAAGSAAEGAAAMETDGGGAEGKEAEEAHAIAEAEADEDGEQAEEEEEEEAESSDENSSVSSKERQRGFSLTPRRERIYHLAVQYLHATAAGQNGLSVIASQLPRFEYFWSLLRVLCVSIKEKQTFLSSNLHLRMVNVVLMRYNKDALPIDHSRAAFMQLLEYVMFSNRTPPPEGWEEWFKQNQEDEGDSSDDEDEEKEATDKPKPPMPVDPILATVRSRPDWMGRSPLLSDELIPSVVTLLACSPTSSALARHLADTNVVLTHSDLGREYIYDVVPRVWRVVYVLVRANTALHKEVTEALQYWWSVCNGVFRDHAFFPSLLPIVMDTNGLFATLLRLSDEATAAARDAAAAMAQPPAVPLSFRYFCISKFWHADKKESVHAMSWALNTRVLGLQLSLMLQLLLRTDTEEHADEDAAHFITTPSCVGLLNFLRSNVLPHAVALHTHFPALVQLLHRLFGTRGPAVRAALQRGEPVDTLLPAHVVHCCRELIEQFSTVAAFLIALLHWWALPAPAAAAAAPVAAASAPAGPSGSNQQTLTEMFGRGSKQTSLFAAALAAIPAVPAPASTLSFPGVAAVLRLPSSCRRASYDVLLCAVAANSSSSLQLIKRLLVERRQHYVLEADAEKLLETEKAKTAELMMRVEQEEAKMADEAGAAASATEAAAPVPSTTSSASSPVRLRASFTRPVACVHALLTGREYVEFVCELTVLSLPGVSPGGALQIARLLALTLLEFSDVRDEVGVTQEDLLRVAELLAQVHAQHGTVTSNQLLRRVWPRLLCAHPVYLRPLDAFALDGLVVGGHYLPVGELPEQACATPEAEAAERQRRKYTAEWKYTVAERQVMLSVAAERLEQTFATIASSQSTKLSETDALASLHAFSLLQRAQSVPLAPDAEATAVQERQLLTEQLAAWMQRTASLRANAAVQGHLRKASEPLRAQLEPTLEFLFA
jgi:hypothetical protein